MRSVSRLSAGLEKYLLLEGVKMSLNVSDKKLCIRLQTVRRSYTLVVTVDWAAGSCGVEHHHTNTNTVTPAATVVKLFS